jgi:hypothetical protein
MLNLYSNYITHFYIYYSIGINKSFNFLIYFSIFLFFDWKTVILLSDYTCDKESGILFISISYFYYISYISYIFIYYLSYSILNLLEIIIYSINS